MKQLKELKVIIIAMWWLLGSSLILIIVGKLLGFYNPSGHDWAVWWSFFLLTMLCWVIEVVAAAVLEYLHGNFEVLHRQDQNLSEIHSTLEDSERKLDDVVSELKEMNGRFNWERYNKGSE